MRFRAIRRRLPLSSVRTRLALGSMGVQALVLVAMGTALWQVVRINLISAVDRSLQRRGEGITARWERRSDFLPTLLFNSFLPRQERPQPSARPPSPNDRPDRYRPRLFDAQDRPMFPNTSDPPWNRGELHQGLHPHFATLAVQGDTIRVLTLPLTENGQVIGHVQVAASLEETDQELRRLTQALMTLIPLALLVTGVSGLFLTAGIVTPVRRMAQAARKIGAANLSDRLPVQGQDEFADLARTFNALLQRLEQAFQQERRFIADASHELRTPLTAILAHTSLSLQGERTPTDYRRALEGTQRAAVVMNRIVQDLLLLARLDRGKEDLAMEPVSLQDVLEAAVEMVGGYAQASIDLKEVPLDWQVCGDFDHLVRLFANLLDNAARHTPAEGHITVSARRDDGRVHIAIADTGTGIAPEHLPLLTERFYRVDAARSRGQGGTGLGLTICKSIVDAHAGSLDIESAPGRGTTVTVTLPLLTPHQLSPSPLSPQGVRGK
ncbi:MAG TPA: ATP-binding protein [Chthonomonadaceae bacterium]|nr:ATP-binding protein [Chthonomonadaceae bacterium]